ncbi:MAG: ComEC/Rec2 family competence protein [Patescibacteria group bacterium]
MELSRFFERGEFCGGVLGAFILGIAAHSIVPFVHADEVWITSALLVCVFAAMAFREQRIPFAVAVLVVSAVLGFWRFNVSVPERNDGVLPWMGQRAEYRGVVQALSGTDARPTATVRVGNVGADKIKVPGNSVVIRLKQTVEIGSEVSFICTARTPGTFPANLERRRSLAKKGVWAECTTVENLEVIGKPNPFNPLIWLARWREWLTRRIAVVLPRDEATLLSGILYGDQDLTTEQRDLFQRSGLMHIVAVSGSNVTIVVSVLLALVLGMGFSRRRAFWIVSSGLLVFIGFVGFGASVLRAAAMGWLAILARQIGRPIQTDRLLVVAAAVLNIFNPWLLAYDPGFALSFLATWGLLAWTPIFQERLTILPNVFSMRETLATTSGATLMTVPYMAWAFGRMSLAGLLTNALALPLVPWAMLWGAGAAAWGSWPGFQLVCWPTLGLLRLIIWIAHLADYVPWLNMQVKQMEWAVMGGCYILIWQLWRIMRCEESRKKDDRVVDSVVGV